MLCYGLERQIEAAIQQLCLCCWLCAGLAMFMAACNPSFVGTQAHAFPQDSPTIQAAINSRTGLPQDWNGKTCCAYAKLVTTLKAATQSSNRVHCRMLCTYLQRLMAEKDLSFQSTALALVCDAACCQYQGRATRQACLLANQLHTWCQHVVVSSGCRLNT